MEPSFSITPGGGGEVRCIMESSRAVLRNAFRERGATSSGGGVIHAAKRGSPGK